MRFRIATSVVFAAALAACGTADTFNGPGALESANTTGSAASTTTGGASTGAGATTAGATTSTTTGGMSTSTTTTAGMSTTTTGGTSTTTTGGMGTTTTGGTGLDPNAIPTNVFFGNAAMGGIEDSLVLVFSTRGDYCTQLKANKTAGNSVNLHLVVQSVGTLQPGNSYAATQATEEVLDAQCNDTSTGAAPASVAISNIGKDSVTGTVVVTLQGQTQQASFTAQSCSALSSQAGVFTLGGLGGLFGGGTHGNSSGGNGGGSGQMQCN